MAIAALVRPRFGAVAALLALTLLRGHEPRQPIERMPPVRVSRVAIDERMVHRPPAVHDRMVIEPPETGDRMAIGSPGPVVALLSGLFELLGSRGA